MRPTFTLARYKKKLILVVIHIFDGYSSLLVCDPFTPELLRQPKFEEEPFDGGVLHHMMAGLLRNLNYINFCL